MSLSQLSQISQLSYKFLLIITITLTLIQFSSPTLLFELPSDRFKCFIEELSQSHVMMLKYKVRNVITDNTEEENRFYNFISISITSESTGHIEKKEMLKNKHGKITYKAKEGGRFKICTQYHGGWKVPFPALMSIKINSDASDEMNLAGGIKNKEIGDVQAKLREIKTGAADIAHRLSKEVEYEDEIAKFNIINTKSYYYMAVAQVLIILILGVFQVFRFRKFLSSSNII